MVAARIELPDGRGRETRCRVGRKRGATLRTVSLVVSLALCGASAAPSPPGGPDEPDEPHEEEKRESDPYRFHVSVSMVALSVTVLDRKGRLVRGLDEESFSVYEDGVEQEIAIFSREDLPLRAVILLDTSASMAPRLAMAREAAIQFVRSMKPEDRVSVVEFNERALTLADFTSDFDVVEAAIRRTAAGGPTSLYNALYAALRSLPQQRKGVERQAIVVLSDGADNHSLVSFEDVRDLARRTDVTIFGVGLLGPKPDLKDEENSNVKYALEKLAEETGGAAFLPERIEDLSGVYDRIAAELESQYNLGYVSSNGTADGAWRDVDVLCHYRGSSGAPGVEVRTRRGYYAPKPAPSPRRRRR